MIHTRFSPATNFFRAGRTKYRHFHETATTDTTPALWEADPVPPSFSAHFSNAGPTSILERSSTPLHFLSEAADNSQQVDPTTLTKISVMEEELAALRKQIANLVMMQETKPQGQCCSTVV